MHPVKRAIPETSQSTILNGPGMLGNQYLVFSRETTPLNCVIAIYLFYLHVYIKRISSSRTQKNL